MLANLSHAHSRVRQACLEALDALATHGALPAGTLHEVLAPGLRAVAYDRAPAVREALFAALARWLGAAPPPAAAAEGGAAVPAPAYHLGERDVTALLPILLVGVSDPQPHVAAQVLAQVERVGDAWLARGAAGEPSAAMQVDGPALAADASGSGQPGGDEASRKQRMVAACHLGPPYAGRPGEGARRMARALLPTLLPPVVADLTAWTAPQRAAAVRSLLTLLVLAEEHVQVGCCFGDVLAGQSFDVFGRGCAAVQGPTARVRPVCARRTSCLRCCLRCARRWRTRTWTWRARWSSACTWWARTWRRRAGCPSSSTTSSSEPL